jgi:hypothetical protein
MALTRSLLIGAVLLAAFVRPASAQVPFPGGRSLTGSIQCRIETTGSGYSESQVHTWTITGAAPTTTNAADGTLWIHQAQWSASGRGTSSQPWGTNGTVSEQWTLAASPMDAPIAIRARVSDLSVELWHSPIRVTEGASGSVSRFGYLTNPNPVPWKDALREAPLVAITSARLAASISGTSSVKLASYSTHGQPAGSSVVETCTWQLAPAATSSNAQPPPPPSSTSSNTSTSSTSGTVPIVLPPDVTGRRGALASAPAPTQTPALTVGATNIPTLSLSVPDGPWSGEAQCTLTSRAANYEEEQIHTWRITAGPPRLNGMFRQWPAVWSARGSGRRLLSAASAQGAANGTGPSETWTINAPEVSAPIAVSELPGARIKFGSQHGLLVANAAITGRTTTNGKENPFAATFQEWAFPVIEDAAASITIAGTSPSRTVPQNPGWRQPPGSTTTESCTWKFTRGAAAPPSDDLSRVIVPAGTVAGRRGEVLAPSSPQPPAPLQPETTTLAKGTPLPTGVFAPVDAATINTNPAVCSTSGGPTLAATTTPGGVTFKWPAPSGATGYTVARQDLGVLTATPITALTYSQSAALDYHNTYQYSVTAYYSDGKCARTSTTITPPKPITPQVTLKLTPGAQTSRVNLAWPDQTDLPTSYLILGPGLHEAGAEVTASRSGQAIDIDNVPSGNQTWVVMPLWRTPTGLINDLATAARVTATVATTANKYAIYIAGFRVNNGTYDNQLNTDGWLDEIYAAAAVTKWESGAVTTNEVIRGAIHGDANQPNFVRAGSGSATGGLKTGDTVPSGWGPSQPLAPEPIATRFPIKLWEGTLRSKIDVVAVRPTMWEFDGDVWGYEFWKQWVLKYPNAGDGLTAPGLVATRGAQTPLYQYVTAAQFNGLDDTIDAAFSAATGKPKIQSDFRYDGYGLPVNAQRFYPGRDRIIGLDLYVEDKRGLFIDVTKPNLGSTEEWEFSRMHWVDRQVAFTREKIEAALNGPAPAGFAPGTVAISLVDKDVNPAGPLHGDYTLYLRVIRVP